MNLRETLIYLTGADYLKMHLNQQQAMLAQNIGNNELHLPLEEDFKTAGRVYADRLRTIVGYPLLMASRLTGIDTIVRKAKQQRSTKL